MISKRQWQVMTLVVANCQEELVRQAARDADIPVPLESEFLDAYDRLFAAINNMPML